MPAPCLVRSHHSPRSQDDPLRPPGTSRRIPASPWSGARPATSRARKSPIASRTAGSSDFTAAATESGKGSASEVPRSGSPVADRPSDPRRGRPPEDGLQRLSKREQVAVGAGGPVELDADWKTTARQSRAQRSEEHTSELQSHSDLVCRLLLEKKNILQ